MEEKNEAAAEYRDTVNLTYITNIAQLERQLQAIEMSYMTDNGVLEPLNAVVLASAINGSVIGSIEDGDVVEDSLRRPRVKRLKSMTQGVYRMVKSDVGLILLLGCYMTMGAAIFSAIEENSPEEFGQSELHELKNILNDICDQIHPSPQTPEVMFFDVETHGPTTGEATWSIEGNATRGPEPSATRDPEPSATRGPAYEDIVDVKNLIGNNQLVDAGKCHKYSWRQGYSRAPKMMLWSFWGAMYFCVTVVTTVGYGNIVPTTDTSRVATMVYAALGIPLCLVVLSKVGKSLTRVIKFQWSFVRRFYYTGSCQRVRRMIPLSRFRRSLFQRVSDHVRQSTVRLTSRRRITRTSEDRQRLNEIYIPYEVDDKFNLPPVVAITIAFLYFFLGAFMYTQWEEWTYLEAFYFTFISLCTIGFGDVVPEHPNFFLASSVYLLFGLALVAMVINVIMEAVTDTINKAKDTVRQVRQRIIQIAPSRCLATPNEQRKSLDLSIRRRSV